jgi:fused signal recognition particle receptor
VAARLEREEAARAEAARLEAEAARMEREATARTEVARQASEAARLEAEAAAAKNAEDKRTAEEAARVIAEEHRAAVAVRAAEQEKLRLAEESVAAESAVRAEAARIEADQQLAAQQEAAQQQAERLQAEVAPTQPLRTTLDPVATGLEEITSAPAAKPSLMGRLMGRSAPQTVVRRTLDDDMLEQLEELLIAADMGVDTALRVTANMAEGRLGKKLSVSEIKDLMASEIARIMEPVALPLPLYSKTPQVVLVVGVNGSGKTTTIGKFASQFKAAGKKVVIAAGDTFRAAAVEQLQVWGERAGVPVLTAAQGSDPASLAFDAMTQAEADGADLLLIDTAGRLQNRSDLMEELAKIVRVIRKKDPTAPHNTLLVLDATTGQNALNQVKVFQEISDVSGLIMTKLDGTAKGGVLVALADKFGLPIHAIGVGEQIDDLQAFDPQEFADALVGYER